MNLLIAILLLLVTVAVAIRISSGSGQRQSSEQPAPVKGNVGWFGHPVELASAVITALLAVAIFESSSPDDNLLFTAISMLIAGLALLGVCKLKAKREERAQGSLPIAAEDESTITPMVRLQTMAHAMGMNAASGSDQGGDCGETTPLKEASLNGRTGIVKQLLNEGADVNATDNDGRTALMAASHNGHADIAKLLLNKGADADIKDNDGATALACASRAGHADVVKLLQS